MLAVGMLPVVCARGTGPPGCWLKSGGGGGEPRREGDRRSESDASGEKLSRTSENRGGRVDSRTRGVAEGMSLPVMGVAWYAEWCAGFCAQGRGTGDGRGARGSIEQGNALVGSGGERSHGVRGVRMAKEGMPGPEDRSRAGGRFTWRLRRRKRQTEENRQISSPAARWHQGHALRARARGPRHSSRKRGIRSPRSSRATARMPFNYHA